MGIISFLNCFHQNILHLLEIGIQNSDEKVASLCSILNVSLLQLQRRIPVVKSDLNVLLSQCQSLEVSILFISLDFVKSPILPILLLSHRDP
jgi:hypothetical protein